MKLSLWLIGREAGKSKYPMHDDSSQDSKEPQERLVIEVTAKAVYEIVEFKCSLN
jgi:hypothetical protein